MTDTPILSQPFRSLAEAAGFSIPEDRIPGVNALVAELQAQAASLRAGLSPVDEPANIYPAAGALT